MRPSRLALLLTPVVLAAGCSSAREAPQSNPSSTSATSTSSAASSAATSSETPSPEPTSQPAPTTEPAPTTAQSIAGKTVVIDPGHNGANSKNLSEINKQVPDGNGGTKPCNTTGTATNGGYAEHEMNWQIAILVRDQLAAQGATVVLTRQDDAGVGPCVNVRAQIANDANADAFVSIHGDGAAASSRGFFCILTPLDPGGPDIAAKSQALAQKVRDGIASTGVMPTANYEGADGINPGRADLAGLNLSTRPTTLCELGNMRSEADAAVQTSESGRAALATGIANGIVAFLAT